MNKNWRTMLAMTAMVVAMGTASSAPAFAAQGSEVVVAPKAKVGASEKVVPAAPAQVSDSVAGLDVLFDQAASEFGVPKSVLMAVAYNETRWQSHGGEPSVNNGFGIMHLVDNNKQKTLDAAAKALGANKNDLRKDNALNIRGGAFLLAKLQKDLGKELTQNPNEWYEAVAAYEGASTKQTAVLFADDVYKTMEQGATIVTSDGASLSLEPTMVQPKKGQYEGVNALTGSISTEAADYSGAIWNAASTSNYQVASRPTSNPITSVIIHDTEGSYSGTINWFKDPAAQVSAHYVVRSSDGQITQMVAEKDIAWHARSFNTNGIGIEHEGYANQTGWYTTAMYNASAALTRYVCQKYGIPMDRNHILAHSELWGNDHTDPGKNWDWNYYMSKVTGVTKNYAVAEVDDSNFENGGLALYGPSQYWHPISGYGIHNQMTYTNGNGSVISNYAIWTPNIPTAGNYEVKVFIPSNYAGTAGAKYEIHYNGGVITKTVRQVDYSNAWVSLGTYSFAAGTGGYVKLGDNTGDTSSIGVDGMKFMAQ